MYLDFGYSLLVLVCCVLGESVGVIVGRDFRRDYRVSDGCLVFGRLWVGGKRGLGVFG